MKPALEVNINKKETENVAPLILQSGMMRAGSVNELADLGFQQNFIDKAAKVLSRYTKNGLISILEVNPAAEALHGLILDGKYKAIFKPIFIKANTSKNGLDSPFITIQPEKVEILQAYGKGLTLNQLKYPIIHLAKLFKLGYCQNITFQDGVFAIKANNMNYKARLALDDSELNKKISSLLSEEDGINKFFTKLLSDPNDSILELMRYLALCITDEADNPINILGVQSEQTGNEFWPIIADIDVHGIAERNVEKNKLYDAKTQSEELKVAVDDLIKTHIEDASERKDALQNCRIHEYMGTISPLEVLVYYELNKESNRNIHLDWWLIAILQHGATSNMTGEDRKKLLAERANATLPLITENTKVGVIFSGKADKFLYLQGSHLLAFYKVMNEIHHYNFIINQEWEKEIIKYNQEISSEVKKEIELHFAEQILSQRSREEPVNLTAQTGSGKEEVNPEPNSMILLANKRTQVSQEAMITGPDSFLSHPESRKRSQSPEKEGVAEEISQSKEKEQQRGTESEETLENNKRLKPTSGISNKL